MHGLDCENESDGKGHASEKSDHLTVSFPMSEANENGWENDITYAGTKEDENFAGVRDWKMADGSTSAPSRLHRCVCWARGLRLHVGRLCRWLSANLLCALTTLIAQPVLHFLEAKIGRCMYGARIRVSAASYEHHSCSS